MHSTEFSTEEICRINRVMAGRFNTWLERGYLRASVQRAGGPGIPNRYSLSDCYATAVFKKMTEAGLAREQAAKAVSYVYDGDTILTGGKFTVFWVIQHDGETLVAPDRELEGPALLRIVDDLARAVNAYASAKLAGPQFTGLPDVVHLVLLDRIKAEVDGRIAEVCG